ncbi:MAG TPA: HAMP domain-containing sensor histidine kinase [Anaerolineaceae bacterium]
MRSLRARLILSHVLPVLVILPVVGFALVYLLETQVLLANRANDLVNEAVLVADIAGSYLEIWYDPDRAQAFVTQISPRVGAKVMLLDPAGRMLVSSDPNDESRTGQTFNSDNIRRILAGDKSAYVNYDNASISDVIVPVITPLRRLIGFVRLENPLASAATRSRQIRELMIAVLGAGLLLGVALGLIFATSLTRPLRALTAAVGRLAEGQPYSPVKEQGPQEVRTLVRTFNDLVARLRVMEQNRRTLLANLVHELGTPLGAMQSGVQALLRGADEDPSLRRDLLEGMDHEMARLRALLSELAHLHDQGVGSLELHREPVHLAEWMSRLAAPWREAAQQKGLLWEANIPFDLPALSLDPDRMAQALGNLVSNAIRYTPPGGRVSLSAERTGEGVAIHVSDTGAGIAPEEQEKIFTPFYRGRSARRFEEGMGLGLPIARDLIQAHGGELHLESEPGKGSRFTILLKDTPQP